MNERVLVPILMADDDPEDRLFAEEALSECRIRNPLYFVRDGEELLEYLERRGRYGAGSDSDAPRPGLILLDLKMPKVDGFECLEQIKRDPALRQIPIVVLTSSKSEEDIFRSYDLGVSSFITKPVTFTGLVEAMGALGRYWLEIVELPEHGRDS